MRQKKRAGAAYVRVLLGFDRVGDRPVPNAAEQRVIARIRRTRTTSDSLPALAGALTRDRVPINTGKVWYASTIKALLDNDLHHVVTEGARAAE